MIRTCPRCGDFYADDAVAFCLADGTPLADVPTHGDTWAEATRVVEDKVRVLRRQTRRLRLRRVMTMTTTMLIMTMVVCVIIADTYVYFVPQPEAPAIDAPLTPTPTPLPWRSETPVPTPTQDFPSLPFVPAVTPTPTPEATPTPDRVRNPSGPANTGDTSTPTPTPTATPIVTETPIVKETPVVEETPDIRGVPPRTPTPTPTPTLDRRHEPGTPDPARPSRPPAELAQTFAPEPEPDPAPEPVSQCRGDDRKRLKKKLVARFEGAWISAIVEDRSAVARQYAPRGAESPQATLLRPIKYEVEFSDGCEPVFVRAKYKWRIIWRGGPWFNSCSKRKDGQKTFPCRKGEAEWRCA